MKTQAAAPAPLDRHAYVWLGRLVAAFHPDVAASVLATYYDPAQRPYDTRLENITHYFESFCALRSLDITRQRGRMDLANTTKAHAFDRHHCDERMLFIAAMVQLYRPAFARTKALPLTIKDRLPSAIALVLGIHRSVVARKMQQVVFWGQELEEFRTEVETIAEKLKTLNPET